MTMHKPPHPGEFIREIYIEPFKLSSRQIARSLNVAPSTLNRLLNGKSNLTPEMALRLSAVLGRSPESWLAMQDNYSLWEAKQKLNPDTLERLELETA